MPSARAPGAGARTFGVVAIGPSSLPRAFAAELETAAAAGLAASGGAVVPRPLTARAAGSCETPDCLQGLARGSGAEYLLRGSCEIAASTYRVHLELVDGASGTVAVAREDTCEICTEHDVVEATNIAASALKATLDHDRPAGGRAAPGANLVRGPREGERNERVPAWRRAAPWVAFVAAAGAIGVGAYYLSLNDDPASCDIKVDGKTLCRSLYTTGWEGAAFIGAGVIAGALGVVALTWTPSPREGTGPKTTPRPRSEGPDGRPAATRPMGVSFSPAGVTAWSRF